MRLPTRKSELVRNLTQTQDNLLTQGAILRMEKEVERLKAVERPPAIAEMQRTAEMGDFSENAAYQMAKWHLRGINARITILEEKLKSAIAIPRGRDTSGRIQIGATVKLRVDGKEVTFEILGSQESNPARGRISHSSPLGHALLGHKAGETVEVSLNGKVKVYEILEVR